MKILDQTISEAFEILTRDNPHLCIAMDDAGVWAQTRDTGDWRCSISVGIDGVKRLFEPGEMTLSFDNAHFTKHTLPGMKIGNPQNRIEPK